MKIFRDDKVYVQKSDIAYLDISDASIPSQVYYIIYGKGPVIIGEFNRLQFEEYSEKQIIDFFREIPWILDYDDVKDLTNHELGQLVEELLDQRNSIANMYNRMNEKERKRNSSMRSQCELLDYKMETIREFQMYKNGNIKMQLPKGIETNSKVVLQRGK